VYLLAKRLTTTIDKHIELKTTSTTAACISISHAFESSIACLFIDFGELGGLEPK